MSVLARDLEFLVSLADEFFAQRSMRRTLSVINSQEIAGWEKWLQVEFAAFIHDHSDVKAWSRETPYLTDKRIERARQRCAVDFIVHQKYKQSHLALEFKQMNSVARCSRAMVEDILKMLKIRTSEFDIRSVWCIGIHARATEAEVLREVKYYSEQLGFTVDERLFASRHIGNTGYSFSIV